MNKKTILLAGSGHAHLEVIKLLTIDEIQSNNFILVSPSRQTYYSGLIPRFIASEIQATQLTIESADYATKKGMHFIQDSVQSIDESQNQVRLQSGQILNYDLLSLNTGGLASSIESENEEATIYLRPFDDFIKKWQSINETIEKSVHNKKSLNFVVVGGGAAAVEVATALSIRLEKIKNFKSEIHLITRSSRLCENYPEKISTLIYKSLLDLNIKIYFNENVEKIEKNKIILSGHIINYDFVFIVTPTMPSDIIKKEINSKLQVSDTIFSVGDGTKMYGQPKLPRSGVIAVHQGRHLTNSIKNILNGKEVKVFKIPSKQLNILIASKNSARLVWGRISIKTSWILDIKNLIDHRYIRQFNIK